MSLSPNEQQLLADLTKHPGWQILKQNVETSAEKRALGLAKILLFTDESVDQISLAYERGYYKAMYDLIRRPEQAITKTFREEKEQ
jgi:hypothetical protein